MQLSFSPLETSLFGLIVTAVLILVFVILASRYLMNHILSFTGQAWLVALNSLMLGIHFHNRYFIVLSGIYVILRGIILPLIFLRMLRFHIAVKEDKAVIGTGTGFLIGLALVVIAFLVSSRLTQVMEIKSVMVLLALHAILAIFLLSFLILVIRHHALSKVIALLIIENSIVLGGQLLILDSGLFVGVIVVMDVLVGTIAFQVLIRLMREKIGDTDNRKLTRLKG